MQQAAFLHNARTDVDQEHAERDRNQQQWLISASDGKIQEEERGQNHDEIAGRHT